MPAPPGQALARTPTGLGDLTTPAAASSPMTLATRVDSCAPGQPEEQVPVGGPRALRGAENTAEPQGHTSKEEK